MPDIAMTIELVGDAEALAGIQNYIRELIVSGKAQGTVVFAPDYSSISITSLDLSERPLNCLLRAGIRNVAQLRKKSVDELFAITNFGMRSLDEVNDRLRERGIPEIV